MGTQAEKSKKEELQILLIFRIVLPHLFIDRHIIWKDRAIFSK